MKYQGRSTLHYIVPSIQLQPGQMLLPDMEIRHKCPHRNLFFKAFLPLTITAKNDIIFPI